MRVLVVGGSGFIGTRLLDVLLERGHDVTNFDRNVSPRHPELSIAGDVRSAAELEAAGAGHDAVVHLAAEHRDDVQPLSLYEEVNVGGAASLIAAATAIGINRLVFTSTVAVYGLDKNDAAEDSTPEPFNEYGRSKLAAEMLFIDWAKQHDDRSLVIVRPSVVFGEGNRGNVYTLAKQVASGRFVMVGDGSNKKSMSYVGNIVEYLADSLDAPSGVRVSNFADKPDLSTKELIATLREALNFGGRRPIRIPFAAALAVGHACDAVARVSGRTFPVSAIRVRKFVSDTTVNTDRLMSSGYQPKYALQEAIRLTIESEFPERARPGAARKLAS